MPPPRRPSRRDPRAQIARDVWRLTAIAWKTLCAALLPLAARDLTRLLPKLLDHLTKYRATKRVLAIDTVRARLEAEFG